MSLYRQSLFIAFLITLTHPALADYPYHTTQYIPQPYLLHHVYDYTSINDGVQFMARLWYGIVYCVVGYDDLW